MAHHSGANFFATTLTAQMNPTDLVCDVDTTGDIGHPAFMVIDPRNPDKREVVLFDEEPTATRFETSTISNRYLDGSAAGSGLTHEVGTEVWSVPVRQEIDHIFDEIDGKAPAPHGNAHHDPDFAEQADHAGHVASTDAHSATSAPTASRIVVRDAASRARFADPDHAQDAATRGWVETEIEDYVGARWVTIDHQVLTSDGVLNLSVPAADQGAYEEYELVVGGLSRATGTGVTFIAMALNGDDSDENYRWSIREDDSDPLKGQTDVAAIGRVGTVAGTATTVRMVRRGKLGAFDLLSFTGNYFRNATPAPFEGTFAGRWNPSGSDALETVTVARGDTPSSVGLALSAGAFATLRGYRQE